MKVLVRECQDDIGSVELFVFTDTGFQLVPATKADDRFPDWGYGPFAVAEVPHSEQWNDEPPTLGPVLGQPTMTLPRDVYDAIRADGKNQKGVGDA